VPEAAFPSRFIDRLLPAPVGGGFRMEGYWIWCGSVVRGEDGRYHMFTSRIPQGPNPAKKMPMSPHWLFSSEIVRADSDTPAGPYTFREVVLPRRDRAYFDGMCTHNPTVHRAPDGTFLLYYLGVTYAEPAPLPDDPGTWIAGEARDRRYDKTWANKRIGLATSRSVLGPWRRADRPLLDPRPGKWDAIANTNPAPCILADGSVRMLFKARSVEKGPLQIGLAVADHWSGPYRQAGDEPVFRFDDPAQHIEDPYLWREGGRFHAIMKDMEGGICGERHAGIYATSDDCTRWAVQGKAYSRQVRWDDGTTTTQGSFERPQLLIEEGVPTHLFAATGDGPGGFWNASTLWNMCVPLRRV
jgi:hypothetical protein